MRIALVAPFDEPVPPPTYGGIERVVANLAKEFDLLGHEVYLLASGDSTAPGHLLPTSARGGRQQQPAPNRHELYRQIGVTQVIKLLRETPVDIVHNHLGWPLLAQAGSISAPMITTLHGPLNVQSEQDYYAPFKQQNFVSISKSQRTGMPNMHYVANIYNGIDMSAFSVGTQSRTYLAFLGRISPEKGIVEAIEVAQTTGLPLIIAAKVDPVDQDFFQREVAPRIDGKQIKFIGEIDQVQKTAFLQQAIALLMPIQWEEPFGLVSVEAMASGAPVLGLRRGALPEIIQDGVNGFLCRDINEMVAKVALIREIDAHACRASVEQKFSSRQMALQYIQTFEHILRRDQRAQTQSHPATLLA